ncbi:excalibur calcium-binding domain-containing protein [Shewanella khirikhana]|uniref:excalibur calcium-binding domain-containing protein n=1 Tax=Shewanella khirikhana TaxID=1965282 RepID=UPI0030D246EA
MQRGTLIRWNADRGFGFIKPERADADDVFIHISSLKHMIRPPQVGDIILFQIEIPADGKPRAGIARIEGVPIKAPSTKQKPSSNSGLSVGKLLKGAVLLGLIAFAIPKIAPMVHALMAPQPDSQYALPDTDLAPLRPVAEAPSFRCEGKTHCREMRSCEEATFYINNCPNTKMDGDGDGIPCERQLCGHF